MASKYVLSTPLKQLGVYAHQFCIPSPRIRVPHFPRHELPSIPTRQVNGNTYPVSGLEGTLKARREQNDVPVPTETRGFLGKAQTLGGFSWKPHRLPMGC